MLAASYAAEKGLTVRALVPEFGRLPEAAAVARRDAELVALADAAVLVLTDRGPGVRRLLEGARAKGIPVHVVGEGIAPKVKTDRQRQARRQTDTCKLMLKGAAVRIEWEGTAELSDTG